MGKSTITATIEADDLNLRYSYDCAPYVAGLNDNELEALITAPGRSDQADLATDHQVREDAKIQRIINFLSEGQALIDSGDFGGYTTIIDSAELLVWVRENRPQLKDLAEEELSPYLID